VELRRRRLGRVADMGRSSSSSPDPSAARRRSRHNAFHAVRQHAREELPAPRSSGRRRERAQQQPAPAPPPPPSALLPLSARRAEPLAGGRKPFYTAATTTASRSARLRSGAVVGPRDAHGDGGGRGRGGGTRPRAQQGRASARVVKSAPSGGAGGTSDGERRRVRAAAERVCEASDSDSDDDSAAEMLTRAARGQWCGAKGTPRRMPKPPTTSLLSLLSPLSALQLGAPRRLQFDHTANREAAGSVATSTKKSVTYRTPASPRHAVQSRDRRRAPAEGTLHDYTPTLEAYTF
jgi:hypothetical protein